MNRTPGVVRLLVAATFVVILNETTMINAIPRLMADFDVDPRSAQWLSTSFMLTMAAVIPVTGWFLQRVTTRTAYSTAMTVFSAGTLLAALAPTFEVLLLARVVQASGTAVMMPLLMTTVMTVVPEDDRGRVMGNVMLAVSCAPAVGPALCGLVLSIGSWRLVFGVVLPIAIAISVAGLRRLENIGRPVPGQIDWPSVVLAATGFGMLVYGLSQVGQRSVAAASTEIAAGAMLIAFFAARQLRLQRDGTPLLDLSTLTHSTYRLALLTTCAAMMAFLGALILLPLYLQNSRGLTALQTGLLVMPGGLAMGLLGPHVGKTFDRFGARPLVFPGAVGMVACLAGLTRLDTQTPYVAIAILNAAFMACLAVVFTPLFTLGLGDLPPQLYSHGSSLLGALQQVSGAIGTAIAVATLESKGTQYAFGAGLVMAVAAVALAIRLPGRVPAAMPATT